MSEVIKVFAPGVREKFESWIKDREGVSVWENAILSDAVAGYHFSPKKDANGNLCMTPHWSYRLKEVITDINRFQFVREMKEVKRFHVAVRFGSQGLSLKLTDASSRRVRRECDKIKERYDTSPVYNFDYNTQECVIEIPILEDSPKIV